MPIMTKMRDNMPTILIGLVVVFLITIVFEWGMNYTGQRGQHDAVGVIEGKKISYAEFSELVKRMADNQKQQSGIDPTDETMRQIREQVWNSLVSQALFEKVIAKAGIAVSNQEIVDWVRGENPPEFLIQQFKDSTGRFQPCCVRISYQRSPKQRNLDSGRDSSSSAALKRENAEHGARQCAGVSRRTPGALYRHVAETESGVCIF